MVSGIFPEKLFSWRSSCVSETILPSESGIWPENLLPERPNWEREERDEKTAKGTVPDKKLLLRKSFSSLVRNWNDVGIEPASLFLSRKR